MSKLHLFKDISRPKTYPGSSNLQTAVHNLEPSSVFEKNFFQKKMTIKNFHTSGTNQNLRGVKNDL